MAAGNENERVKLNPKGQMYTSEFSSESSIHPNVSIFAIVLTPQFVVWPHGTSTNFVRFASNAWIDQFRFVICLFI
jgi:hypothetical protein